MYRYHRMAFSFPVKNPSRERQNMVNKQPRNKGLFRRGKARFFLGGNPFRSA
jgi:hypothetical protein